MTITAKRLVTNTTATLLGTMYTTPTNAKAIIKRATLSNNTSGAVVCGMYLVPSGSSAAAPNCVFSSRTLASTETYVSPEAEGQVLDSGGTLQAIGNGVTLVVSGVEIT